MMCIRHQLLNVFMSELLLRDQSRKKKGDWVDVCRDIAVRWDL